MQKVVLSFTCIITLIYLHHVIDESEHLLSTLHYKITNKSASQI